MTVEQTDVIDVVSYGEERIILSIADHLDWDDKEHLLTRQEKINKYLEFVESGQIWNELNYPKTSTVEISLLLVHEPNKLGVEFLSRASDFIKGAGFEFNYSVPEHLITDEIDQLKIKIANMKS